MKYLKGNRRRTKLLASNYRGDIVNNYITPSVYEEELLLMILKKP